MSSPFGRMARKGVDMLDRFYSDRRVLQRLRGGPLGPYMDSFAALLFEQGFARETGQHQLRLIGALSLWLERLVLGVEDLDEQRIGEFLKQLAQQRVWIRHTQAVLFLLLGHLREAGILPMPVVEVDDTPIGQMEREFGRYLVEQRGLSATTVQRQLPLIRWFLGERFGAGPLLLSELAVADVTRLVLRCCRPGTTRRGEAIVTALRSFFRFLRLRGDLAIDLAAAVPRAAYWRLSGLPKSLPAGQVQRLLESCDRGRPVGQRNYALLLLLARLGLRAGEIVALRLEDLDWQAAELTVRGKGRRQDRLPMLEDVGAALAAYLHHGRPRCSTRRVFVRSRAPYRELGHASTVSTIVRRALQCAGLNPPSQGAHLLRHSLATEMLRRQASLGEIGEILRHRQPSTTEIYAKVDLEALRALAQPWPGAHP
jgi:site-specific recombinase XerD